MTAAADDSSDDDCLQLEGNDNEDEELQIEDNDLQLERNGDDDSDDGGLQLEGNEDDDGLQLEGNDDDDDDLQLEGNDDDDGLQLEGNDDDDDDGLQLEGNADDDNGLQMEANDGGIQSVAEVERPAVKETAFSAPLPRTQKAAPMLLGVRVVINGLVSKPELNGAIGLAKTFDEKKQRYGVKVDGATGSLLALRPENLSPAPKKRVEDVTADAPPPEPNSTESLQALINDIGTRHERALALKDEGRPAEASNLLADLMVTARRTLGHENEETLAITNNLSAMLQLLGKHKEAAPLAEEVVTRRRTALGPRNTLTINALVNLGSLLLNCGETGRSIEVRREVFEAREASLGRQDASTLLAMDNLAMALVSHAVEKATPGEPPTLEPLEESVALVTEEMMAYIKQFGKDCPVKVPAECRATGSKVFQAVMKHPELGIEVKGYNELVAALQKALMAND